MQFRLLGPLEVDAGEGPLPLGGPKQRAVLAQLLIRANEVVPTETLLDEIWGEEPPETARKVIQTYVSHLRKVVGQDRLQGGALGYRLRVDPSELDVARFDALLRDGRTMLPSDPGAAVALFEDALALWRGSALAGVVADQPSLLAHAARLEEERLEAQEGRVEALLATGADARAVGELEILLAQHPLREGLWGQLMLALYRQGRQADALATYQRAREILADELGIDPSPELGRLHERILQQDPRLDALGEPLRGYRLLEKIGEGATGVVFRAIQPQIARDVAVKIFHEHLAADPSFVRRFEREAQAVGALEHPHIVPIYDYWREPGRAYIVSRYVRTGSLRALVQRGERLEPGRAVSLVEQIATALAFAHRQGIAHGDVRLSNLFVDADDNAYLGDFLVGVDPGRSPADDVQNLISVARELLGGAMPLRLAELAERAEGGTDIPTAEEIVAATRRSDSSAQTQPHVIGDERNPYKGLRPFTEADAADFFGRRDLVRRLVSRLGEPRADTRFLAVVGPSGGGKSSVVRAGLVPAVRRGALGDERDQYVAEMFPGPHPIEELEAALLRTAVGPLPQLRDRLESGSRGLLDAVDRALPSQAQLLLVVDQFEEVFTLTTDEQERELFLESLRVAAADAESRVRVLVTLRADFFDRPLVYPRFGELLARCNEAVPPLVPDELEQAIRAPAQGVGIVVEPGLVAEMVADAAHQPGALPLIQYALTELFERRDGNGLTLAGYDEIGGIAGALSARAERIYTSTDAEGRRAIKQVFLRLVTLGEGREDTRRRVPRSELDELDVGKGTMDAVLGTFGRHRLLTFDREPVTRAPTVEIAHEALMGAWTRFHQWIDDGREDLRQNRRLVQAGAEWRGSGEDPSFLLRGTRLEQVEEWTDATQFAITKPDRAFLKASVDHREEERVAEEARIEHEAEVDRRSIRRLRSLVVLGVATALVATTLTVVAVGQRQRAEDASGIARDAETAQLAQRLGAQALVEEDLELSLLLARQAVAIDDSPQTRGYLLAALQRSPQAIGVMRGTGLISAAAVSPDGKTLAVTGYDDDDTNAGLQFFDTGTFRRIGDPLSRRFAWGLAYRPDGRAVAVGGDDVNLIDPRTGEQLAEMEVSGTAARMAFTKDGSELVVLHGRQISHGAQISILDAATLRRIGPPIQPGSLGGGYVGFEFQYPYFVLTPDDRSLVTASQDGELALWDIRTGDKTRTLPIKTGLHALALSPDGGTAAVGIDGGIQLVDLASGHVRTATGYIGGRPTWLLFNRDGDTVVSTNLDGTVTLWDVGSATPRETLRGHTGSVQQPVFSPDGGETLYTVSHDGTAIAWDMTGERRLGRAFRFTHESSSETWGGHPGRFSPDGHLIAVGLRGRGIALWDADELTRVGFLQETGKAVQGIAFSPDGHTLAAASFHRIITLWDVGSRSRLLYERIRGSTDDDAPSVGIGFSPDGRTLAITTRSGLRLVDVSAGGSLGEIGAGRLVPAFDADGIDPAFSADGTMIATARGFEGGADVWDAATGTSIASVGARPGEHSPADGVALSPDGRTLAIGGWGPVVRLIDVPTGNLRHELDMAGTGVFALEFTPDSRTLAVSGWGQGVASLWDVATGTQIGPRLTAGSRRTSLDVSPDGQRLLLTASNGDGAVWDIDPESWKQRACDVANRTLTPEEWEEFLPGRPYEPACAA
jgi:WD40 repeat protein/DNA-binding SARP family transcriptional activator